MQYVFIVHDGRMWNGDEVPEKTAVDKIVEAGYSLLKAVRFVEGRDFPTIYTGKKSEDREWVSRVAIYEEE